MQLSGPMDTSITTLFQFADIDGGAFGYPDTACQEIRLQGHKESEHFHFLGRDLSHDNTTSVGCFSREENRSWSSHFRVGVTVQHTHSMPNVFIRPKNSTSNSKKTHIKA